MKINDNKKLIFLHPGGGLYCLFCTVHISGNLGPNIQKLIIFVKIKIKMFAYIHISNAALMQPNLEQLEDCINCRGNDLMSVGVNVTSYGWK